MRLRTLLSAMMLCAFATLSFMSAAHAFDDMQKKEIEALIRDYLLKNPEVMLEVQQRLEEKREASRKEKANEAVARNSEAIFSSKDDIALGNPNGKITIVEFFDYNCSYCKNAMHDMDTIIKANPDVRFVLKEFPILGEDSIAAHRISDALRKIAPEKYGEFHRALLGGDSRADEAQALAIAASLGVGEDKIRATMKQAGNEESVRRTYKLAEALGVTGTPAYIVGDEAIFGAIGVDAINSKLANMASCGKATC